jgi:hypothetical protein
MFAAIAVIDFLNSREDAVVIWAAIAVALIAWKVPDVRPQFLRVVQRFFALKLLLGIWLPMTLYVSALVGAGWYFGIWHTSSLKETLIWFIGTGLVLGGGATQTNNPAEFKKLFVRVLGVSLFVEFLANLYPFPLAVEIVLVPLVVVLVLVNAVAELDPKYGDVSRLVGGWLLPIIGVTVLTYAGISALRDLGGFLTWEHLEQFLVPIALTVGVVPFLFYVALWSTYEIVFARLNIFVDDKAEARRAKLAVTLVCGFSLRRVGRCDDDLLAWLRATGRDPSLRRLITTLHAQLMRPATVALRA